MKKFTWLLSLMILVCGVAQAKVIPAQEPGQQIGYMAVVLCEELTLREKPSASSKAVKTLQYGDLPIVVNADAPEGPAQENGFVYCTLGDGEDSPTGWLNAEYIFINPAWYVTEKNTAVYAWDETTAPKIGLLEKDTRLPVLKEVGDWYIVSLRGAVGWIHK